VVHSLGAGHPFGASPYGALDMAGNVGEWVADLYSETYYSESPSNNPTGPSNSLERVFRGGSFYAVDWVVRSGHRNSLSDASSKDDIGFRCVWSAALP
jgi:sulfatase modifying factor 1